MPDAIYDAHYRDDPAACGEPFPEFVHFCEASTPGSVLDLGCGQGRDALLFARAGHQVVGVDVSAVGIEQLLTIANAEGLAVQGIVADVATYRADATFDVVTLDRVLHMIPAANRQLVLRTAMDAVAPGGHLLVAEGPSGLSPVRQAVEREGWALVKATRNRLIARRLLTP